MNSYNQFIVYVNSFVEEKNYGSKDYTSQIITDMTFVCNFNEVLAILIKLPKLQLIVNQEH